MTTLSKTLLALLSGLIIAITGILLYVYWPAITGTINDSQYLTPEQGQEMYDKGYADGNKAQEEQIAQIAYYKELTDEYYIQVGLLNNEISNLNGEIVDKNNAIIELTNVKNTNLQTIADLNNAISVNESVISNLNSQISTLQTEKTSLETQISSLNSDISNKQVIIVGLNSQVSELQADITNKQNRITELNGQINTLQAQIEVLESQGSADESTISTLRTEIAGLNSEIIDLENTITSKNDTITSLTSQISLLNAQVTNLYAELNTKSTTISSLNNQISNLQESIDANSQVQQSYMNTISSLYTRNEALSTQISNLTLRMQTMDENVLVYINKINELQNTIRQYEAFIDTLELNTQRVVTFEYDGAIINIQVVNVNDIVSIANPANTTYKQFNGWKVNGTSVNLAEYPITEDVKFVADITYSYDVNFALLGEVIQSNVIVSNGTATVPSSYTSPKTFDRATGTYYFQGWTLDGETIIDVASYSITENTTFIAKVTRQTVVRFMVDDTLKNAFNLNSTGYGNCAAMTKTTARGYLPNCVNIPVAEYSSAGYLTKIRYSNCSNMTTQVYCRLNGWKLNGTLIDLNSYILTDEDVTFEADIEYAKVVTFKNGYNNAVLKTECLFGDSSHATPPTIPSDSSTYYYDGWVISGVDGLFTSNEIANYTISASATTITARCQTKYNIVFRFYDSSIISELGLSSSNITVLASPKDMANASFRNSNLVRVTSTNGQVSSVYIPTVGTKTLTSIARFNGFKVNGEYITINTVDLLQYANSSRVVNIQVDIEKAYAITFADRSTGAELFPKKYVYKGVMIGDMPTMADTETTYFAGWANAGTSTVRDFSTMTLTQNITVNPVFTNKNYVSFNLPNIGSYLHLEKNYVLVYYSPSEINDLTFRQENFIPMTFVEGSNTLIDTITISGQTYEVNGAYEFNGWKMNGNAIDINTVTITGNPTINGNFTLPKTWQTIYTGSKVFHSNYEYSFTKTMNVSGLTTSDTFRVGFSNFFILDEEDQSCIDHLVESSFTVQKGETHSYTYTFWNSRTFNITVSCSSNGVLTITGTSSGANDFYFSGITVNSVEVYR